MGATSALVFRNLDCLSLFAFRANTTLLAFKTLLFLFFPKSALLNWECGLSTDAAYTWTFTVLKFLNIIKSIWGKLYSGNGCWRHLGKIARDFKIGNFEGSSIWFKQVLERENQLQKYLLSSCLLLPFR